MKYRSLIFIFALSTFFLHCNEKPHHSGMMHPHGIIPAPKVFEAKSVLKSSVNSLSIFLPVSFDGTYLSSISSDLYGIKWVQKESEANVQGIKSDTLPQEAYRINVEKDSVTIHYGDFAGLQYALTSLIQMVRFGGLPLNVCIVDDRPKFQYRGMHLDVARHFFKVDEVKKYLDYMAFYKYNYFHWHLTDDQGWRIEIKKYPKLQEVGAWRKETLIGHYNDEPHKFDGKKYGGYYTQDEIREIVQYAAQRHITVIPEIEMPGHALAALAAYPELGCGPGPYETATKWGVFNDVFCPTETTLEFLEGVIEEVVALFPSGYIHIGGDECPKEVWKKSDFCQKLIKAKGLKDEYGLQSYFISRMEKYINAKGRQIIGWDEIMEGGLAPNATVMSWRGTEGGIEAANAGHKVIMTPGSHCYFDHYQSESSDEPLAIGGFTPIEKVYHWNPVPDILQGEKSKFIIGGQANLWTEYITEFSKVEYMAFARGLAMSEVLWGNNDDYQDFLKRFNIHYDHWRKTGAKIAYHLLDIKPEFKAGDGLPVRLKFAVPANAIVEYIINGQVVKSAQSGEEIIIDRPVTYTFQAIQGDKKGKKLSLNFDLHLATNALIDINPPPSPKYAGNGPASLVNGISGRDETYSGTEWLGFEGTDAVVTLDFQDEKSLNQVMLRFFKGEGQWIYLPPLIELYTSADGINFAKYTSISNIGAYQKIGDVLFNLGPVNTRFLRIHAYNFGVIPDGKQGAGHRSWLFMDEIMVR